MVASRVKLFSLEDESSTAEFLGPCNCEENESYKELRLRLESVGCLEWPFVFWDIEECCKIKTRLEGLNTIGKCVYVIRVSSDDGSGAAKRRRLEGFGTSGGNGDIGNPPAECVEPANDGDLVDVSLPVDSSRVSGDGDCAEANDLKSTLLPKEVLDKYMKATSKLKKEDHEWKLKSWDLNGIPVVKVYCGECDKDFRGTNGDYSKNTIHNLFANFKKSHI
jgi:hypothetical protein